MKVEIVTIGDELLIGQVTDTNSAWIARELNKLGFIVNRVTSISDNEAEILAALDEATARVPVVLITGGLGPTRDDITKTSLCKFFDTRLVFNEDVFADIQQLLKSRVAGITQLDRDQAMIPEKCEAIPNKVGTAPILWFNHKKGAVIAMPGVPSEMMMAMTNEVLPRLNTRFERGIVRHKTVHVFNIPEAVLAGMINDWEMSLPGFIKLAYLPAPGKVRLRLTATGTDATLMELAINKALEGLYPIIGDNIYGFDDELPHGRLLELFKAKGLTIGVAESCTGGYLSYLLTSIPGSSAVFKGSVIAYSNEVKVNMLGVDSSTLAKHGAVSLPVAKQMAKGIISKLKTDYAIAITGIAGPDGGTAEKPVGTVCIAWASKNKVHERIFNFGNQRDRNTIRAAEAGAILLLKMIENAEI